MRLYACDGGHWSLDQSWSVTGPFSGARTRRICARPGCRLPVDELALTGAEVAAIEAAERLDGTGGHYAVLDEVVARWRAAR